MKTETKSMKSEEEIRKRLEQYKQAFDYYNNIENPSEVDLRQRELAEMRIIDLKWVLGD